MWEVSRGGAPVAWLFGTVHALPPGLDWRTPAFDKAFAGADLVLVEIAELEDNARGRAAFEAVSRSPGLPPLGQRVPASARPRLAALLDLADVDARDLQTRETWAAALILTAATRRHDPALGVDRAILDKARRVEGLESHAAQFARFDRLSQAAQDQLLLAVADDALAPDPDARLVAWLTGDLAKLQHLTAARLAACPELHEALVTSRNRAWATRTIALIQAGERPFVAVGAGHMLGEDGLPALLAQQGFTLTRLQ